MADKIAVQATPWFSIIQIIFIVLKLVGAVSWSWGIVLIPFWISLGIAGILAIIFLLISLVAVLN